MARPAISAELEFPASYCELVMIVRSGRDVRLKPERFGITHGPESVAVGLKEAGTLDLPRFVVPRVVSRQVARCCEAGHSPEVIRQNRSGR